MASLHIPHFKDIRQIIRDELTQATLSIKIAVCWFTDRTLFKCLIDMLSKGVTIELIITYDARNCHPYGLGFQHFIDKGGFLYLCNQSSLMHNKYCIIDGSVLINGSYNWTDAADSHFENIIVHKSDPELISRFINNFMDLKCTFKPGIIEYHPLSEELYKSLNVLSEQNDLLSSAKMISQDLYNQSLELESKEAFQIAHKIDPYNIGFEKKALELNWIYPAFLMSDFCIALVNEPFKPIFYKNTSIPCEVEQEYSTADDFNSLLKIELYIKDIRNVPILYRYYVIKNLPKKPSGEVRIKTKYKINSSGWLFIEHTIVGQGVVDTRAFDLKEKRMFSTSPM